MDNSLTESLSYNPDIKVSSKQVFGIKSDLRVPAFSKKSSLVPKIDKDYFFDNDTTISILTGFSQNKRVLIQGYHGTGKTTHIEQIAARLNWPCIRINLDSHITRGDLVGKDIITIKKNKQITEYKDGMLPWAIKRPTALVFDEYDAGKPEVMFVIQRILESDGKFTLLDNNEIITPHPAFRLFATSNTIGQSDNLGIYHGTNQINQGQMDRWNIVSVLNYLSPETEAKIVINKTKISQNKIAVEKIKLMIALAGLVRKGFVQGDLTTVLSPRTIINWAENYKLFNDLIFSFKVSFLNKCDETEKPIVAEYFQRVFNIDLPESEINNLKKK
ncbi:MAG: cobaltochelatase subunit CobS [Pelagibacteraceae bacterium]|nr:cobaltochelatase subunit CobS [Pelagibacteraceae bacterium]|tara:strand:+ start:9130 stop:10122 length:993 start_codon:yes stop_codon:yes gene_type:complete